MASYTCSNPVFYHRKCCKFANNDCANQTNNYYDTKGFIRFNYTQTYDSQNVMTVRITGIFLDLQSVDVNYFNSCGGEATICDPKLGCCDPVHIYYAVDGGFAELCSLTPQTHYYGTQNWASVGSSLTFRVQPGSSYTFVAGKGSGNCHREMQASAVFTNNLSKPVEETAPTVILYCSNSTTNPHSLTVTAAGTTGTCEGGANASSSFGLYTDPSYSISSRVSTSSGVYNAANSNTTYYARYSVSNSCKGTVTKTCQTTTIPENQLRSAESTGPNNAKVTFAVMGGPAYDITTQLQMRKCTSGQWETVTTKTTKKGSSTTTYTVDVDTLEQDTCYQFQVISTTTAGRYVSNTLTAQTPKVGAFAFFDSIESEITSNNDITTTFCYNWKAENLPAQITVYYRVKDGYDPTWIPTNTITVTAATGNRCVTATGLFPNQVEYETYIHTYIPQYDVEWDGDITTFITPLLPVPEFYQCETLGYMVELLCSSVKRLYNGVKTIYANPASREECDPYSEEPTMLTLWSRALRFFTAVNCLAEGMMGTLLMQSKPGQYLVGENGWTDPLEDLDDWNDSDNLWRLPSGKGTFAYLNEKMHSVWHYHSSVDYLVQTLDELKAAEGAKSGIVMDDNKVYTKAGNGRWVASTTDVPDDFAVYHINKTSKYAEAGQAWFYWGGTWKNLDSDIQNAVKRVQEIEEQSDVIVDNEPGAADMTLTVVPETYDFDQVPDDGNRYVYLLTENPNKVETPTLRVVFSGWTPELSADNVTLSLLNPDCEHAGQSSDACGSSEWRVPVSYYSTLIYPGCDLTNDKSTDGSLCRSLIQDVPQGGVAVRPPDPVYGGHKFLGWRLGTLVNNEWVIEDSFYDFSTPVNTDFITGKMCLFGQWARDVINVGVNRVPNVDGPYPSGRVEVPALATVGEWGEYNEALDYTKYTSELGEVVGWSFYEQELACDAILENNGYSVQPVLKYYTVPVTFVLNNGQNDIVQEVQLRTSTTAPTNVEREGYEIDHWSLYDNPDAPAFDFNSIITEPITLYAIWVATPYTVTFDSDGGTPVPPVRAREHGYIQAPAEPTNGRCTFQGWYTEGHYVSFDSDGAGYVPTQGVVDGGYAVEPPTPSRGQCAFLGWYYDDDTDTQSEEEDKE